MAQTNKIFIDTSFLISFIDRGDLNHAKTVKIMEFLAKQSYRVYTSELIVLQTFSRLERDFGSVLALEFLRAVLESDIQVFYYTKTELLASYRFLKSNLQRQASLVDIINANLMVKSGVNYILTYDLWQNLMGTSISNLMNS